MPSSANHQILPASHAVGHGSGLPTGGKLEFPELFARFGIEGSQVVVHSSSGEDQTARGRDRTAKGDGAGVHIGKKAAQRNIPGFFPGEQIHCRERAPGWRVARKAAGREQRCAEHGERRAGLCTKFAMQTVLAGSGFSRGVELIAWN